MAKANDRNYVSVWFWLFATLVMAIPLVNIIMTLIWAFAGENESRKNYFRALLIIWLIAIGIAVVLLAIGMFPEILRRLETLTHRI